MSSSAEPRTQLAALIRQYQRDIDAFDQAVAERAGINRTDLRCLDLLLELVMAGGGVTPARLSDASGLTASTVTSVLDRLEKAGYVRRVRDQENRRQVFLQLTEEFAVLARELFGPVGEEGMRQLQRLSDAEVATLIKFFSQSNDRRAKRTEKIREETARDTPARTATRTSRSAGNAKDALVR
ncbi:MAG: MarR family winged helix-turn-helix transcriptional regulator [Acidimicrobiales bacterium]